MEGREEGGNERGRKEREKASNGEGSKKGNDTHFTNHYIHPLFPSASQQVIDSFNTNTNDWMFR